MPDETYCNQDTTTIYRVPKRRDFTQVWNGLLQDRRLSYGARGMLAYIFSLPPEATITNAMLEAAHPGGRHATNSLIRELKDAGYMTRRREYDPDIGQTVWRTSVYEDPDDLARDDTPAAPERPTIRGHSHRGELPETERSITGSYLNTNTIYNGADTQDEPPVDRNTGQEDPPAETPAKGSASWQPPRRLPPLKVKQSQIDPSGRVIDTFQDVPTAAAHLFVALCQACGIDPLRIDDRQSWNPRALNLYRDMALDYHAAGLTAQWVYDHYIREDGYWYAADWRGQRNQLPNRKTIEDTRLQADAWTPDKTPPPAAQADPPAAKEQWQRLAECVRRMSGPADTKGWRDILDAAALQAVRAITPAALMSLPADPASYEYRNTRKQFMDLYQSAATAAVAGD